MTDAIIYSCRACTNAIVGGEKPPDRACPACHALQSEIDGELWVRRGMLR